MITRKSLVLAATAILASAAAITLAETSSKPILHSTVFSWAGFKAEPTKTGARRECFDAPTATLERLECHVTTLNPSEVPHTGHQHPEEEVIIVKDGVLEAVQNGRTNQVAAGGIILEASNEPHSLRNSGTNEAVYYVSKVYPHDLPKTSRR